MPIDIAEPESLPKDLSIFYCWQDHVDRRLHKNLIRNALNTAICLVQDELPDDIDCNLRLDSDTTGRAGSVDIANTILEKIISSTIIVGDVTPVTSNSDRTLCYPNPNVMLELGYAARTHGWSRIVCVLNDSSCRREQLPFDIRYRRITAYHCADASGKRQATQELASNFVAALTAIIQSIGRGEVDSSIDKESVKHARDARLLREVLQTINRPAMDAIIQCGLVYKVYYNGLYYWDDFNAAVSSCDFRFYDKALEALVLNLRQVWGEAISIGSIVFFPGDRPFSLVLKSGEWENSYNRKVKKMGRAFAKLPIVLNSFLAHVHFQYPEIDLDETDHIAKTNLLKFLGEMDAETASMDLKAKPKATETATK